MKRLVFLTGSALLLMICSSSAWVKLTLIRPADIQIPENLKSIALIDRTVQEETTKNKIEQVVTGEAFHQDEQAVLKIAEGFIEACSGTKRFETVRTSERYLADGTKTTFPTPLDWNSVTEICNRHNTDVLLSIEIFDTDFLLTNKPVKIDTQTEDGKVSTRVEFVANGVAVINFGIRLYDAVNRVILDEYQTSHRLNFDAQAPTLQVALNQLLDKTEAINRVSYDAGFIYGERITPTYYQVTRYFFDKPKKVLGAGVRYSEVADWNNAIKAWTKVVENGDQKDAGRAAFNIAVAWEVLGDLEKAKDWASRSYTEFEEKDANDYYRALTDRIREEQLVSDQMNQ
ncbi:MAG TPA: DUF6340 family protein [Bacteroidales bacterium]|jgi:hypothetical protein|nr:DUF6340 family protein [Bacteroidales bacterium]